MKCTPQNTMNFALVSAATFRQFVAVAGEVGKTNDFVALVVMAEEDGCVAQLGPGFRDARIHGVVGECEVVFETAKRAGLRRGRRCFVKNQGQNDPPSVLHVSIDGRTEMLKANSAAADALAEPESQAK
jgi:hypothetical protein